MRRKKSESLFKMAFPIVPGMAAWKLTVGMRNFVSIQRLVQAAVGRNEMVLSSTVESKRTEAPCVPQYLIENRSVLLKSGETCGMLLHEVPHLIKVSDRGMS